VILANAIVTEVASYLVDNYRSHLTSGQCPAVKASLVHYNTTMLSSASVKILQNWMSDWDCSKHGATNRQTNACKDCCCSKQTPRHTSWWC